tara:strand:+ start:145146 stop:145271 length:126 start_codon:yes stop_codon:yes gene_type:complete
VFRKIKALHSLFCRIDGKDAAKEIVDREFALVTVEVADFEG